MKSKTVLFGLFVLFFVSHAPASTAPAGQTRASYCIQLTDRAALKGITNSLRLSYQNAACQSLNQGRNLDQEVAFSGDSIRAIDSDFDKIEQHPNSSF